MSDLLLDRAEELATIERALRLARAGHGRSVLVCGLPGTGKTVLLAHARARAAAMDVSVLAVGGEARERAFPFGVARRLLQPEVAPPPGSEALLELTGRLAAEAPALVAVDDLQWSDAESLEWLGFAARRLRATGIALVAAAEDRAAGRLHDAGAIVLEPRPFSERAVAALLHMELGRAADPRFVRECHALIALLACWVRTTDLGAYGRQAVVCRHSGDRGATWAQTVQPSPASVPGVPFGPYVGGVAVAARRGAFTVAWVDTLGGTLDGTGLDSAWVSRSTDGATWSPPVRAARWRALPERFPGDSFRNVTLLALAETRGQLYLAYAADIGGQADVQLVRSGDAGRSWSGPVTVGAGVGDQFQPSLAVTRSQVFVSFLDRRLDPAAAFADEWLAVSSDDGSSWRERRLSHDSWDPAIGAPRSPTGDLLGDHQALVARGCTAVALAADPHLANAAERDRDFDHRLPRASEPQLFAWTVREPGC